MKNQHVCTTDGYFKLENTLTLSIIQFTIVLPHHLPNYQPLSKTIGCNQTVVLILSFAEQILKKKVYFDWIWGYLCTK